MLASGTGREGAGPERASERYNLAPSSLPQRNKAEKALWEQASAWEFRLIDAEQAIPQFLPKRNCYCLRNVRPSSLCSRVSGQPVHSFSPWLLCCLQRLGLALFTAMIFDGRSAQPTHYAASVMAKSSSHHPLTPLWDEKRPSEGPELASPPLDRERETAQRQ